MKKLFCQIICLFLITQLQAQSYKGVTGEVDSSYTTVKAYLSTIKTHPQAEIVYQFFSDSLKENRRLPYCVIPGRRLEMDMFSPEKPLSPLSPALIIVHGGGWRSGNRTQHYPLAQRLALMGYTCFTPEYRLSTEELYPAAVHDIKAAIRWVKANATALKVDTNKLAVIGFSAGGELAAFMGATNGMSRFEKLNCNKEFSSLVQAVVDIDGTLSFIHPESSEGDDSKSTSAATYWFGYSKLENPALWKDASPLTHVGKHSPPILFLNSSVASMHAGREDFIAQLKKYGIYSEVHQFDNSPHSFCLFEPWFTPTVGYIDSFLKKVFNNK